MAETLLEVKDLHVSFRTEDGVVKAVDGVSFTLDRGEVLGIVGESGSGKSVTAMSIMRLINDPNLIVSGEVIYKGRNVTALDDTEMYEVRGREIAMIFQDPMTSLNPVYTIGDQIMRGDPDSLTTSRRRRRERHGDRPAAQVGIPKPERRVDDYPAPVLRRHAAARDDRDGARLQPELLIADEPTTALDVTIQAQILELIDRLQGRVRHRRSS